MERRVWMSKVILSIGLHIANAIFGFIVSKMHTNKIQRHILVNAIIYCVLSAISGAVIVGLQVACNKAKRS